MQSLRFEMLNNAALPHRRKHLIFLRLAVRGHNNANGSSDRLWGGEAEDAFGRSVPRCNGTVEIPTENRIVTRADNGGQVASFALQTVSPADIAGDLCAADDLSIRANDRRDRHHKGNAMPVFVDPLAVVGVDLFAASSATEDRILSWAQLRRHHKVNRLSEGLHGDLSQDLLSRWIPRRDHPAGILAEDHVVT